MVPRRTRGKARKDSENKEAAFPYSAKGYI